MDRGPARTLAGRPRGPLGALLALVVLAAPSVAQSPPSPGSDPRPNVLLVYADDLRADAYGAAGNPALATPHLDGLAARGTSFLRAYCMGSPHGARTSASTWTASRAR